MYVEPAMFVCLGGSSCCLRKFWSRPVVFLRVADNRALGVPYCHAKSCILLLFPPERKSNPANNTVLIYMWIDLMQFCSDSLYSWWIQGHVIYVCDKSYTLGIPSIHLASRMTLIHITFLTKDYVIQKKLYILINIMFS